MIKESALISLNSGYVSSLGAPILTFKGIPIRDILGDMYNKYDKFKLVLNSHSGIYNSGTATNQQYFIRVSGLDFINTTEYIINNNYPRSAIYMLPIITSSQINLNNLPSNYGQVFNKPTNSSIDLTIVFLDRNLTVPSFNIGTNMFVFSIYGVEN